MKIGVIGIEGGWSSEGLANALSAQTGFRLLIDMEKVRLDLASGQAWYGDIDLSTLDGLVIKKIGGTYSQDLLERLEVLRFLNMRGLPVYSSPLNIMRVLDRLSCTVTLRSAGLPVPPTTITEDVDEALTALSQYGRAVLKPMYSTKARGMVVVERNTPDSRNAIEQFKTQNRVMYIQKAIDIPERDLGVVFLGGRYLTTYARRKNGSSWTTSTHFGGTYESYEPSFEIIGLAQMAQDLFDLDFTCVDVAITEDGPYIFEVSAFGGFRGIQAACALDAASLYAKYVIGKSNGK